MGSVLNWRFCRNCKI